MSTTHKHTFNGANWIWSSAVDHHCSFMCNYPDCGQVTTVDDQHRPGSSCWMCGYTIKCEHNMLLVSTLLDDYFCHLLNYCKHCGHRVEITKPTRHDWEDGVCRSCKTKKTIPTCKSSGYDIKSDLVKSGEINNTISSSLDKIIEPSAIGVTIENNTVIAPNSIGSDSTHSVLNGVWEHQQESFEYVGTDQTHVCKDKQCQFCKTPEPCSHSLTFGDWVAHDEEGCSPIVKCTKCDYKESQLGNILRHCYDNGTCRTCGYKSVYENQIEAIQAQTGATRERVVKEYKQHNRDPVDTIMALTIAKCDHTQRTKTFIKQDDNYCTSVSKCICGDETMNTVRHIMRHTTWVFKDEQNCYLDDICVNCGYIKTIKVSPHNYRNDGSCLGCGYMPSHNTCVHLFVVEKASETHWYAPDKDNTNQCAYKLRCQLCEVTETKSSPHIFTKTTDCVLCGFKRSCNHKFVHQPGNVFLYTT